MLGEQPPPRLAAAEAEEPRRPEGGIAHRGVDSLHVIPAPHPDANRRAGGDNPHQLTESTPDSGVREVEQRAHRPGRLKLTVTERQFQRARDPAVEAVTAAVCDGGWREVHSDVAQASIDKRLPVATGPAADLEQVVATLADKQIDERRPRRFPLRGKAAVGAIGDFRVVVRDQIALPALLVAAVAVGHIAMLPHSSAPAATVAGVTER